MRGPGTGDRERGAKSGSGELERRAGSGKRRAGSGERGAGSGERGAGSGERGAGSGSGDGERRAGAGVLLKHLKYGSSEVKRAYLNNNCTQSICQII